MDYEYYYNNARSRYYNACSEINSCVNRINALNSQKWQKINYINQLKTDIKNYQEAFNEIEQILKNEEILNQKLLKISNATDQATVNYNNMISSDNIVKKNLNDIYSEEALNTKQTLNSILNTLRIEKNNLSAKIAELQAQLSRAESELSDIASGIRSAEGNKQDWNSVKSSASYDMEYYRRKMNEAV